MTDREELVELIATVILEVLEAPERYGNTADLIADAMLKERKSQ